MTRRKQVLREYHEPTEKDLLFLGRVDERLGGLLAEKLRLDGELAQIDAARRALQLQIADCETAIRIYTRELSLDPEPQP